MRTCVLLHGFCIFYYGYASKAENRLYRDLLSNYNKLIRPVRNPKETLKVEMKVFLQQIVGLDGKNQIMELNAWLKFIWMDYRLAWDPWKYENVTSVRFAGGENQIWRPDVLLYNSANEDFDSTFKSNEVVYSTGEVNWVPPGILRASCKMDITYFPFDEQLCYLKFGSWTYNKNSMDLGIIVDEDGDLRMDLSTYIPSGEWNLLSAPAVQETIYSICCPEPYSTVTFHMILRRRTIFYLFNIVLPSLVVSLMTLIGFCLPAHDMSEKIGYQTTILLSICFFVTIVSEMTPATSESVPLLGMFFSTLTLIVSVSTTFTITVLHFRYRQPHNARMSLLFRCLFLEVIPKFTLLTRPGRPERLHSFSSISQPHSDQTYKSMDDYNTSTQSWTTPTVGKMSSEQLFLDRKVGTGILTPNRTNTLKRNHSMKQKTNVFSRFLMHYATTSGVNPRSHEADLTQCYFLIHGRLKKIRERTHKTADLRMEQEEWKFAALALDRFCLIMFTLLIVSCVISIIFATPHFDA